MASPFSDHLRQRRSPPSRSVSSKQTLRTSPDRTGSDVENSKLLRISSKTGMPTNFGVTAIEVPNADGLPPPGNRRVVDPGNNVLPRNSMHAGVAAESEARERESCTPTGPHPGQIPDNLLILMGYGQLLHPCNAFPAPTRLPCQSLVAAEKQRHQIVSLERPLPLECGQLEEFPRRRSRREGTGTGTMAPFLLPPVYLGGVVRISSVRPCPRSCLTRSFGTVLLL